MLESRIEAIFPSDDYQILKTFAGKELKGLSYEPVFRYFSNLKPKAFVVLVDDYVTAESGKNFVLYEKTNNLFMSIWFYFFAVPTCIIYSLYLTES